MFQTKKSFEKKIKYYSKEGVSKLSLYREILNNICKGDMMQTVWTDTNGIDSAIPMSLWKTINTGHHVYSYKGRRYSFGRLVNVYIPFKRIIKKLIHKHYK